MIGTQEKIYIVKTKRWIDLRLEKNVPAKYEKIKKVFWNIRNEPKVL